MTPKKLYACDFDWSPVCPGDTIKESIEYYGLTQKNLAERTGFSIKHINQVILGNAPITPDFAVLLERVLGTSAETWNRLEANYQTRKINWIEKQRLQKEKKLQKNPVIIELKRRGYISGKDTAEEVASVLKFFGVGTPDALTRFCNKSHQFALRHSPTLSSNPMALTAWLRIVEHQALLVDCAAFDKQKFRDNLKKIRSLTVLNPEEFVPKMVSLCSESGVSLVFVPEFPGIASHGAAKWQTATKAIIALNLRGKRNDLFWFTFYHEAAHILFDGKKELVIESGNDPNSASEKQADMFAVRSLIPPEYNSELPALKTGQQIQSFAEKLGIASGIVVGRLQHDGLIKYSAFNYLKKKFVWDQ